jgi:hypothetical protein
MSLDPLILPRRLAIALLAEAQKAAGAPVAGVIGARDGVPVAVHPDAEAASGDETLWASYRSTGGAAGGAQGGRELLISIDTKGVLQLSCWESKGKKAIERELRII